MSSDLFFLNNFCIFAKKSNNMEEWKDIKGLESIYQISNYGRVKSLGNSKNRKEKILKLQIDKNGYLHIALHKNGKTKNYLIHRLVAQEFIPNPYNYQEVNHIDEDRKNNDALNLEWCGHQYNINYGSRNKRAIKTRKNNKYFNLVSSCCRGLLKNKRGLHVL